jgi:hypothetical protein
MTRSTPPQAASKLRARRRQAGDIGGVAGQQQRAVNGQRLQLVGPPRRQRQPGARAASSRAVAAPMPDEAPTSQTRLPCQSLMRRIEGHGRLSA